MTTPESERALVAFTEARLGELYAQTGEHFPGKLAFTSVRELAATWKDHPDYRPEWAPDTARLCPSLLPMLYPEQHQPR